MIDQIHVFITAHALMHQHHVTGTRSVLRIQITMYSVVPWLEVQTVMIIM